MIHYTVLYNMDMSLVDSETFRQLDKVRPVQSELDLIVAQMTTAGDLDKPDMSVIVRSHDVV